VNNEIEEVKDGEVVKSEAQDAVTVIDAETATSSEEGKINSQSACATFSFLFSS
jgi:hypothetical protein